MNNIEKAKKIINETKTALIKYITVEEKSVNNRNKLVKFIKENSNYNILHFAAKGSFPKTKNVPIKSLLESAIINRVINKLNPKKSEIQHFTESCKSVLLSNYTGNRKATNFIMNEASSYEICYLTMVGKLPTNYSTKAQHYLFESIGNKIAKKYGKTSFITEGFIHELAVAAKAYDPMKDHGGEGGYYEDTRDGSSDSYTGHGFADRAQDLKDRAKIGIDNALHGNDDSGTALDYKPNSNPYTLPNSQSYQGAKSFTSAATKKAVSAGDTHFDPNAPHDPAHLLKPAESHGIIDKLQNLIAQGKETGSQAMAQLQKSIGEHPDAIVGAGATAAAGLAIYGANKLYRKYMANASKATQGKPAGQAANILKNAKTKASQAKLADLQKSLAGCKATKNPAKCQKLIQDKIKAERMKASKIKR